ncbi:hypothetical protein [Candidatus Mesenet endosymbiont of Agriotes lineatus]|uniref:hypothetical protein n=1 Tax=Candidatus Mesenet endosymbiont of Agriotes lineatus TaxID=3077948 RepID=UPI0030D3FB51
MKWNLKSKEAFVQALNIEFLTITGTYTNFQFGKAKSYRSKDQICMLFPNGKQEECQKYLEQVTAKYKGAITSFKESNFDVKSFPFCMSPGRFSTSSRRGVKFKVPLDKKVINNLYYMFIFQILSFKLNVTNLPNDLDLDEDDKNKGYVVGWAFPRGDGNTSKRKREVEDLLNKYSFSIKNGSILDENDDLCDCTYIHKHRADEAVQRAIEDFPTEILGQYPTKLLTLFNIFYHDLSAKEGMNSDCEQFIKETWIRCVHTAKANDSIVSFDYYGEDSDKMRDQEHVEEVYNLYKGKETNEIFHNFINLTQKDHNTITVSFNFNLHNMNTIMKKVPCDIGYVEKALEFAIEQRNRAVCIYAEVANNTAPSSSKQNFLPIPNDYLESNASSSRKNSIKSNDSALGKSPAKPSSPELHTNAASFDSGRGSSSNSPLKKYKSNKSTPASPARSDVSGVTVVNKDSRAVSGADIVDLGKKPNEVGNRRFSRNQIRSKSVPLGGPKGVLSAITIRRSSSDIRVKV